MCIYVYVCLYLLHLICHGVQTKIYTNSFSETWVIRKVKGCFYKNAVFRIKLLGVSIHETYLNVVYGSHVCMYVRTCPLIMHMSGTYSSCDSHA